MKPLSWQRRGLRAQPHRAPRPGRRALTAVLCATAAWAWPAGASGGAPLPLERADPWAAVPLHWSVARALLTPARCEASQRARRACVHAIEAALRSRDERLRVRPASLPPPPGEELVRTFGAASIARQPDTVAPADEAAARALVDAWDAVPPGGIPFERVAAWVAETAGFAPGRGAGAPAPGEARATARAVEAFLQTSQDPFARLVPRAQDDRQLASVGASRTGIGVSLLGLPGVILVERVAPSGPAARAGVQPGDVLVSIDGWDLAGLDARDAARLLEGPEGAAVRVGLRRDGRRWDWTLQRARVLVRHAFARVLHRGDGARVGYLRVASLHSERVCGQASEALGRLERAGVGGLVLDLRGNPGGLVEQARCVADLFLGAGRVVATLERVDGRSEPYETREPGRTRVPLVILVDGRTTSAAELLAAALRVHGRALVVGQRTYGKATVQDAFPWAEGLPVLVYRTVGTYTVGPRREALHLAGLVPDLLVDGLGRRARTERARRAPWRYWEALRRPPIETLRRPEAPALACAAELAHDAWLSADGEAVGPQLASAASAAGCAPVPPAAAPKDRDQTAR